MILIVDDDPSITASLALLLKQHGHRSSSAHSVDEALGVIRSERPSLVIQDMNFSRRTTGEEGLALLTAIRAEQPDVPVILMTAWGSIGLAVEGMKRGAADFITKPWSNTLLVQSVETALKLAETPDAAAEAPSRAELDAKFDFGKIIGSDPKMLRVLELIGRIAPTEASVLIMGESGTGKEMVAEAIHANSRRRGRAFRRRIRAMYRLPRSSTTSPPCCVPSWISAESLCASTFNAMKPSASIRASSSRSSST